MTYTAQTKSELVRTYAAPCCQRAELFAFVRINGVYTGSELTLRTEHAAVARRVFSLIRHVGRVEPTVHVAKKLRLKKNNVYYIRLGSVAALEQKVIWGWNPLNDGASCCQRAYVRGAFLAGGSLNKPERLANHLEIACTHEETCALLCAMLIKCSIHVRMLVRKKQFVLYVKESEKISAVLVTMGAHQAMLQFEDVRIVRALRNAANRAVNCETANVNKSIAASLRQVENIAFLARTIGLDALPGKLRDVARLRLAHPEENYQELCEMMNGTISKSGMSHRLRKLDALADDVRARMP
ncbi:MAG: DNA-binding protein WhiA [Paenibacillaceae bacterium]|nr:DNA-binding protein WhiA [Paenibacillaceae bacterium]